MAVRRALRRVRSALARPNAAAQRGLAAARAAMASAEPGPTGDEAIALLEQRRREFEAERTGGQGVLPLRESQATP